jgi:hypothetical protein
MAEIHWELVRRQVLSVAGLSGASAIERGLGRSTGAAYLACRTATISTGYLGNVKCIL